MTPARDSESYVQRYKLYTIVLPVCTAISSIGNFARARPHPHRMMIVISRGQTILHNQNGDRLIFGAMGRQRGTYIWHGYGLNGALHNCGLPLT